MEPDEDLLPISALQHLIYCERQCALIHLERIWVDNRLTVEGSRLHEAADERTDEQRRDVVTSRSVALRSTTLGLVGRSDVVEFTQVQGPGIHLPGREGLWTPRPIEYKRGKPKKHRADEVQLCAQALCLEEMFSCSIRQGDLYYGKRRRRTEVPLDAELRRLTKSSIRRLRQVLSGTALPPAEYGPKCEACSLKPACLPKGQSSVSPYIQAEMVRQGVSSS